MTRFFHILSKISTNVLAIVAVFVLIFVAAADIANYKYSKLGGFDDTVTVEQTNPVPGYSSFADIFWEMPVMFVYFSAFVVFMAGYVLTKAALAGQHNNVFGLLSIVCMVIGILTILFGLFILPEAIVYIVDLFFVLEVWFLVFLFCAYTRHIK